MKKAKTLYIFKVIYADLWGEKRCDLVACDNFSPFELRKQMEHEHLFIYDVELFEQCELYE